MDRSSESTDPSILSTILDSIVRISRYNVWKGQTLFMADCGEPKSIGTPLKLSVTGIGFQVSEKEVKIERAATFTRKGSEGGESERSRLSNKS